VYANSDFPAPQAGLVQILPRLLAVSPPRIHGGKMMNHAFVLSGESGVPGSTYYVLSSGNPNLPASGWTVIATNIFDTQGNFSFSAPVSPSASQAFYRLSLRLPTPDQVLPRTIALFKTPTIRDLGHSAPYLHTGRMDDLTSVIRFYQKFSKMARHGDVRNADPEMMEIFLNEPAIAPLAAFLRSLNEDYTD
jgi:hypothetical protein